MSEKKNPISAFLALPADSTAKTIFMAVAVCLVAAIPLTILVILLRPTQAVNSLADKQRNILEVAGVAVEGSIAETFKQAFEVRILELATGEFTDREDLVDLTDKQIADDPALSRALADDPASIVRQGDFVTVYLLRDDAGDIDKLIMPLHGYGLWSTLYGFIALEENGNDIFGLQFYAHAETPGLGAEVDNPRWKAQWSGKKLADESGALQIQVAKTASAAGADYHIDALAGATLTSAGVNNLVRFWMGEEGYSPFLTKLKAEGI